MQARVGAGDEQHRAGDGGDPALDEVRVGGARIDVERLRGEGVLWGERTECGGADDSGAAERGGGEQSASVHGVVHRSLPGQVVTTQGRRPVDRLAILLYAAGVRSMTRLVPHTEPQQVRSPQNRSVWGPQSAMRVPTCAPLQRLVV